jgi:hypothetical protein
VDAGYPAALAEDALRISTLGTAERTAMLEEAVASGDPEVYWQLFFNSPAAEEAAVGREGLAWLIDACRAGYDCSPDAEWFRDITCAQERCLPDESAVEHYWYALAEPEREQAWRLAGTIQQERLSGRFDAMPWPALSRRSVLERPRLEEAEGD